MADKPITDGASPEALAELLHVCTEEPAEGPQCLEQRKADTLRLRLGGPLPLTPTNAEALSALLLQACRRLLPLQGQPLGETLLDPGTPLPIIQAVKQYAKGLAADKVRPVQHDVSVAIYYAAIAHALVHHGRKITSYTYRDLRQALQDLADRVWMDPKLARLMAKAARKCKAERD